MATITLGTAGTTTLTALIWNASAAPADCAAIDAGILDDQNPAHPAMGRWGFTQNGQLYVPNRGLLNLLPGDVVAFDPATGFPILLSKLAAAGASWVHS